MNKPKHIRNIVSIVIISFLFNNFSFSHSGKTNSEGCHNDKKNKTYHCHNKKNKDKNKLSSKLKIIDGVKSVEDNAFSGNNDINKIVFPTDNTLEYIGASSFKNCNINTPLTIPSRVEIIGNKAFYDNSISDLSFNYGNYLTTISGEAFSRNNYTKLIMQNYISLQMIGYECFANNADLRIIDFTGSSKNVKFENAI